jgi:hypothetical protein
MKTKAVGNTEPVNQQGIFAIIMPAAMFNNRAPERAASKKSCCYEFCFLLNFL